MVQTVLVQNNFRSETSRNCKTLGWIKCKTKENLASISVKAADLDVFGIIVLANWAGMNGVPNRCSEGQRLDFLKNIEIFDPEVAPKHRLINTSVFVSLFFLSEVCFITFIPYSSYL